MVARGKPTSKLKPTTAASGSGSTQPAEGKHDGRGHAPWYREPLILSMAFWTFAIIFCKTTFEYQYNVLVATSVSLNEMVNLTGQLYAAAGLLSSLINLFGTNSLQRHLGMMPLLLSSPVFLFCSALFSLVSPSIAAAFVGRMLDLTLRWSLNNTSKSMLWIAMPLRTQQRAKPWVEGTVKKTATSVTAATIALVLPLAELLHVPMTTAVSCLAAAVALVCCAICFRMHRFYYDAMWSLVLRREFKLSEDITVADGTDGHGGGEEAALPALDIHTRAGAAVLEKLQGGPPHVQLYILRQLGDALPAAAWRQFMAGWRLLTPAVQARVLKMCTDDRERVGDEWLIELLHEHASLAARGGGGGGGGGGRGGGEDLRVDIGGGEAVAPEAAAEAEAEAEAEAAAEAEAEGVLGAVLPMALIACGERRLLASEPLVA